MTDPISRLKDFIGENLDDITILHEPTPPQIDEKKCTGCGICVKECPSLAINIVDGKARHINRIYCSECGHCVSICPAGAVTDPLASAGDYETYSERGLPQPDSLYLFFRSRRSVRQYRSRQVNQKAIEKILEAGRYAPVGGNRPDVHYLVVSTPRRIGELRAMVMDSVLKLFSLLKNRAVYTFASVVGGRENIQTAKFYIPLLEFFKQLWENHGIDRLFYHAPAIIIVHGKKLDDTIPFSCAAALYQSSLMAQSLDLGCCFNGFIQVAINRDKKVKSYLGIPKNHNCYGAMTIGYPKHKYLRTVRRIKPQVTWL